ncbi:MAG: stage II sporulation protein M [Planctomycetales bacterium]|nr:stage II sporulation protein M [Planctomycetales bacterium]
MKVADLVKQRRKNWQELEQLCVRLESSGRKSVGARSITRFATLYRAACADLALADAYQLPPNTVQYLHRLVGRAHNQMYRSRALDVRAWGESLLFDVPKRIFRDPCVQTAFLMFWGIFILSAFLAANPGIWPDFAERVIPESQLEMMEESFSTAPNGRSPLVNPAMASFYIRHNTGIGLQCFAGGLLFLPGILVTVFNSAYLGAAFGYMARPDVEQGRNFYQFVTAHGPFELTAIVLSAGAGLRMGLAWITTQGLTRRDSLRRTAVQAMPIMGAAMVLFVGAAFIEAFISPSALPYAIKATVAVVCSGLLMLYFVVLGFPRTAEPEAIEVSYRSPLEPEASRSLSEQGK